MIEQRVQVFKSVLSQEYGWDKETIRYGLIIELSEVI